jgi:hypothetical protein
LSFRVQREEQTSRLFLFVSSFLSSRGARFGRRRHRHPGGFEKRFFAVENTTTTGRRRRRRRRRRKGPE